MSKRNKKNLKKLAAKRLLLNTPTPESALPEPPKQGILASSSEGRVVALLPLPKTSKEIYRTLVGMLVAVLILGGVIVADSQKPFLESLGSKLYSALRLSN